MTLQVGEVIAVQGVKVILKIFEESSKDTIFYDGRKFKGVSIREYVAIQRGFKEIACIVEGEYLDETKYELESRKLAYVRKVEVKPIGYFQDGYFFEGIKFLPMIKDPVFLVSEEQISKIYGKGNKEDSFVIGAMLKENIPVSLPWKNLFNTHIGIFGNTGSGKSNTLAKLFTTLFSKKKKQIKGKSQFILLDFNGEYTKEQLVDVKNKSIYDLSTRDIKGSKFPLPESEFWNPETLGLLFKATANTQMPFIARVVRGWEAHGQSEGSLDNYVKSTFRRTFVTKSQKKEAVDLLINVMNILGNDGLKIKLQQLSWHASTSSFSLKEKTGNTEYFNSDEIAYSKIFKQDVEKISCSEFDSFNQLIIRFNLQLINELLLGYVQFEHIQPLLKRIEASAANLGRVIEVGQDQSENKILTVISLRRCSQEIKKILPLLLAKHYYDRHKSSVQNPPNRTIHIIIDEAHNVLSQQSNREHESWKDYRLELFEEIIKEGRKFGVFLTLSSQRPADISPTIMSQIHNFFIHRLVNDKDLFLLDNTISTLDYLSKTMIPNLAKGSCIVTGTSFSLPLLMQVDPLEKRFQPDSDDVDLGKLWSDEKRN